MKLLTDDFLKPYKRSPRFGFGDMSEFVFLTKYSRLKENGEKEKWWETVERNVEGIFRLLFKYVPRHIFKLSELTVYARRMYDHMFTLKFLPAGRPLANVGTPIIDEKCLGASLNNCAFISFNAVQTIDEACAFILDMSMLGVGVGVDVNYKKETWLYKPDGGDIAIIIPDTREGWVDAIVFLVRSYLEPHQNVIRFNYSDIRAKGEPIKGMGGVHAGYKPLEKMLEGIRDVLNKHEKINTRILADISNIIGSCVVSGGQRRTALILLGDKDDEEFRDLKNYSKNPERIDYGWTSNNSIYAEVGMDYSPFIDKISNNGEPAFVWLENAHIYGRMNGNPDTSDHSTGGFNPCAEMPLEPFELCNLMEMNPMKFENDDYEVLFSAILYAKILALVPTHWEQTNQVRTRNMRYGISQTGIVEYIEANGIKKYIANLDRWYEFVVRIDRKVSAKMRVYPSVRTTTIKPSGTVSKLMGVTAGVTYPISEYYIRRVRVDKNSGYGEYYRQKGYNVEDDIYDKNGNTEVVEFLIRQKDLPTQADVTLHDQLNLAALLQKHWSNNAVSLTAVFKDEEAKHIQRALEMYQNQLKCISFLKYTDNGYEQLPEESITEKQYDTIKKEIKQRKAGYDTKIAINFPDAAAEQYCTKDSCDVTIEHYKVKHQKI